MTERKRLLWVGDAVSPTGFARVTHEILERVRAEYEVVVLGINYRGDPHGFPYDIYAAAGGGDAFGVGRVIEMYDRVQPDAVVILQDPWNLPQYIKGRIQARKPGGKYHFPEYANIPIIACCPVDGQNMRATWFEGTSHCVFWTDFGLEEARSGDYTGEASVVPLGVDTNMFYPMDRDEALKVIGIPELKDKFLIGNVNRNQPRKRWDLMIRYFAKWIKEYQIDDAELLLHIAPTGQDGLNLRQLAIYYGIYHKIHSRIPPMFYGDEDNNMRALYNCFDLQITTSQGEGFGLTTFEGMACGVPQIVPDWSALGELCRGAAALVPCTSTALNPIYPELNIIHGVADEKQFIAALDAMYRDKHHRDEVAKLGLQRVREERFQWANIAERWIEVIGSTIAKAEAAKAEVTA